MYNNFSNIQPRFGSDVNGTQPADDVRIDIDGGNYRDKPRPQSPPAAPTASTGSSTENTGIFAIISANWMWILGGLVVCILLLVGLIYLLKGPEQIVTPLDKAGGTAGGTTSGTAVGTTSSCKKPEGSASGGGSTVATSAEPAETPPAKRPPAEVIKEMEELRKAQAELTAAPRSKTDEEISSLME